MRGVASAVRSGGSERGWRGRTDRIEWRQQRYGDRSNSDGHAGSGPIIAANAAFRGFVRTDCASSNASRLSATLLQSVRGRLEALVCDCGQRP